MTVKRGDVVLVHYPFTPVLKRGRSSFTFPKTHATPRSGYSSRRGELLDEGLVVRCRHAEIEHIAETAGVARQERPRIQPESGEDAGAVKTVLVRRLQHKASMFQDMPEHLIGFQRSHDIFEHSGPLVVIELWSQVGVAGRVRDLDDQFGDSAHEPPVRHRSTATFREDP